jgi:aspartyl-tRNA synthetase
VPADGASAEELRALYARYNDCCNRHDFGSLGLFVAEDVHVDDKPTGLAAYVAGLEEVVRAFPDYRWELRHLAVEPPLLAAHFADSGTHRGTFLGVPPTGRVIRTQEFAFYRVADGRITDVWVTADDLTTLEQLRA